VLSDLVTPMTARGIDVEIDVSPGLRLSPEIEALLFRSCQELLRNVLTHSGARKVDVKVSRLEESVELVVADDGRGFSPEEVVRRQGHGHFGLRLIADLVAEAGGMIEVRSEPDEGTSFRLEVPTR
jgi:two-component system, NarL family, sensor kinase